ncbi:MAG: UDP-N-acetylglucosamine 2-epimerase (hydrolyzing) [Lachnospiraceae bacterium]|nr:UDP-N-acetylglucosamine 2-epimerase (hydrolyzing) [Lachnospiraceae bacterium]
MKHVLGIVTGTRAEYHLLYPLIKRVMASDKYELKLIVTGSHLSEKHGNTYRDIEADGIPVSVKIPILSDSDEPSDIDNAMARMITGFDGYVSGNRLDMLILLGDRYELMSAAIVAMNHRIPIAHISCGDTTEGAIDECIRHSITKMSSIHFPSCEEYRHRVIQMGEDPEHVFNVGGLGVENIKNVKRMSRSELSDELGFDINGRFAVLTFHPVTLEDSTAEHEFGELLGALDDIPGLRVIFTKANADSGGLIINKMIDDYTALNPDRTMAVYNLGLVRYLSAISMADAVIGNSSSGILETPSFGTPTVNIGDRQKGRLQAGNIVNCKPERRDIRDAIKKCLSDGFREKAKNTVSPYGDGNTSERIIEKIGLFFDDPERFGIKKQFYNIDFQEE